ncbi:large-conductance mechanosensitive channel [Flavobacteriaceae bacterium UJ101]|nr:large-conductance mechanosensitive channel [Flavobacteriaceae bacterium UJ101]
MLKEFKDFAFKGNIIDLATAVIIGGAFGKIVTSFVNDVLMPPIGMIVGADFKTLKYVLKEGVQQTNADGVVETVGEVAMMYGSFIQSIVDFLIVAFCIFMVIRAYNKTQKEEEEAPAEPSAEETLLTEIRDLLKNK